MLFLGIGSAAVSAFYPVASRSTQLAASIVVPPLSSMSTDDIPSDYEGEDLSPTEQTVVVDENVDDELIRDQLKRELLLMASTTGTCSMFHRVGFS